ncbi:MAG: hypothetical protein F2520_04430 [Actinobacteria bacterium]|uniref:Unannotated protein n=1 Tax=freshwater metagenome TaxID=449393 RepID=A0A6J5YB76_9ZZZZ|nr:hypothetical protein [Actinomycetota bacterium]
MTIFISILIAVLAGGVWALSLRRLRQRRQLIAAPKQVSRTLRAYTGGRWDAVIARAPGCLTLSGGADDGEWRPAVELAFGHSLVQRDRCAEAIAHLERGLLLQSARRQAHGGDGSPTAAEAKMRHMLGYAYAATYQASAAIREYRRVLATPGLDPAIGTRVTAAIAALDQSD